MGLAPDIALKFDTSVAKELKLKVRKFMGLILMIVEITGEKLIMRGAFLNWIVKL